MSIRYIKTKDLLVEILSYNELEPYPIQFQHARSIKHLRENLYKFLKKEKVWCMELPKPYDKRYQVLAGDYGSLQTLKYENKTIARRDIQRRYKNIEEDEQLFEKLEKWVFKSEVFISNSNHAQVNFINSFKRLKNVVKTQKNKLHSALLDPNISYRAYPIFKKRY
jgi:hypothetical protein